MPSFLPKTKPSFVPSFTPSPVCEINVADVFESDIYASSRERVVNYLFRIYSEHSDMSFERTGRPGVITEAFFLFMPTVDAYAAELDLVSGIRAHALGNISDEGIKVYLAKYIETHTFVYRPSGFSFAQEFKSGYSPRTCRDVELFEISSRTGSRYVCNQIQIWLYRLLEAKRGEHAELIVSKL